MSICPHVRSLLLSLVNELQNKMKHLKCHLTENLNTVKKWSDVVWGGSKDVRKKMKQKSVLNVYRDLLRQTFGQILY